jgi:rhamnosyltransferase
MATRNGHRWLRDQVDSVLGQIGVEIELWVSDDGSTDGTWEWLQGEAVRDARVRLLPRLAPSGASHRNFYRLLRDAPWHTADFVAFADQDDIWFKDKLVSHIARLRATGSDGVSSNVTAFWPDGRKVLINKAQPQRELDFLFEGPGPGCTFLMTRWLASELKRVLETPGSPASDVEFHDWLAYAVCRSAGRGWVISADPSVMYRQHAGNAYGANAGPRQALRRLRQVRRRWHRRQSVKLGELALQLAEPTTRQRLGPLVSALGKTDPASRLTLLRSAGQLRRRLRDRIALAVLIATGVW